MYSEIESKSGSLHVASLSSCSFWPFAHISNISFKEKHLNEKERTFDTGIALSLLALSLPISVIMILGMLTAGETFTSVKSILIAAIIFIVIGSIFPIVNYLKEHLLSKKNNSLNVDKIEKQATINRKLVS